MSAAAQITAIAVGLAIAAGAGYWAAQLHQSAPQAPLAGAPQALAAETDRRVKAEDKVRYFEELMTGRRAA